MTRQQVEKQADIWYDNMYYGIPCFFGSRHLLKRENALETTVKQQKFTTEYETQTGRSTLTYVVEDVAVGGSAWYCFCKRLFDVAVSVTAGIVLLVPMLIIGLLIRLDSAGPAIYRQERLAV